MKELLEKLDRILYSLLRGVVISLFIAIVILILAQVYTRFFTVKSLTWSEELSRFCLVYLVFFSAVLVTRRKGHLWIENLVSSLPAAAAKVVTLVSVTLQILFFCLVIWGAAKFFPTASMRLSPANAIPMNVVYLCVPVSCVFCIFYSIRDIVEILAKGRGER